MDKKQAIAVLKEMGRRNKPKVPDFVTDGFGPQNNFVLDKSKYKTALTTRRAGKSTAVAIMILMALLSEPNFKAIYVGLTRETAKDVIIPILKELDKKYSIGLKFKETYLNAVTCSNGSSLSLFGLDGKEDEKEKLLGKKLKLAVVDECASYKIELRQALEDHIAPTLIDLNGQLVLIGTPGNNRNYFCDITENRVPGWSIHKWSAEDNPYMREQFLAEIARKKELYPNIEEDPGFQQHYRGKWTIDLDATAYKYNVKVNGILTLPPGKYHFALGVDLGWEDENAFVIVAWSDNDPTLYIIESYSESKMLMDAIIEKLNYFKNKYNIERYVIDAAGKNYVEELKYRTRIPFNPATKQDKMEYVHMMNSDFRLGKIKVLVNNCESLIKEYGYLSIDSSNPAKPKIVGGDHNADAALYIWRAAYHYNSKPIIVEPPKTAQQEVDDWVQKKEEQIYKSQSNDFFDRDWDY